MTAVTICRDFGAQENKVTHCFHCVPVYLPWDQMPWSSFSECWVLSQLFHSAFSLSSRGFLVPLCFLLEGWCHLPIWGYWCFSLQSWFQLVLHPAWHFAWCTLVAQMVKRLPAKQETWVWSPGLEAPLEKEMVTHSSTLAWKIPWIEEPGRLQSMGLQSQTWESLNRSPWPESMTALTECEDCFCRATAVLRLKFIRYVLKQMTPPLRQKVKRS